MLTSICLAALLAITPVFSHPTAVAQSSVDTAAKIHYDSIWVEAHNATFQMKRSPNSETFCGSHTYSTADQANALSAGAQNTYDGTTVKAKNKRKYPEPFGNREGLAFTGCSDDVTGGFVEWPILRNGNKFAAKDDQGPDRIVYKQSSLQNNVYVECGCMTHEGASTKNGFVICTN